MSATIVDVRDYWDRRPCNFNHSRLDWHTREYWEAAWQRRCLVEPHLVPFADYDRYRGARVLELGCGMGFDACRFALAGADVVAVDLSARSLELARQQAFLLVATVDFIEGDFERLILHGPFDLIFSCGAIHHTPDPKRALERARGFCRFGTELKLLLYHRWSTKALRLTRFRPWRDDLISVGSEAQERCPITRAYSRRSARRLVEESGFEVDQIRIDHVFPYRIEDYAKGRLVYDWYYAMFPRTAMRFLPKTLGWHLLLNARYLGSNIWEDFECGGS